MLPVNRKQIDMLVNMMEYLMKNESTMEIEKLNADLGISFEEYRNLSALCMPAIRYKNQVNGLKQRYGTYKQMYRRLKGQMVYAEKALREAMKYVTVKENMNNPIVVSILQEEEREKEESEE